MYIGSPATSLSLALAPDEARGDAMDVAGVHGGAGGRSWRIRVLEPEM